MTPMWWARERERDKLSDLDQFGVFVLGVLCLISMPTRANHANSYINLFVNRIRITRMHGRIFARPSKRIIHIYGNFIVANTIFCLTYSLWYWTIRFKMSFFAILSWYCGSKIISIETLSVNEISSFDQIMKKKQIYYDIQMFLSLNFIAMNHSRNHQDKIL